MIEGILKIEKIERCYLIYGEELFLKQKALQEIEKHSVSESDLMNYTMFEGKEVTAERIINACETMPFFSEHKVVVVKEGEFFKTGKKDETEKLNKWIKSIPDETILVFIEKEVDKRNGLYKSIHKQYKVVEAAPLGHDDLARFVESLCKERKIQMPMKVIQYFVANMPPNIHHILGELNKLETYCIDKAVTIQAVEDVCVFALEQRVFALVKEVTNKQTTKALEIYHKLIEAKESPVMILMLIARQYRILLQVKYLEKMNTSPPQIAKEVGLPLFVVKENCIQAKAFTFKQLQDILAYCLESDQAIKTGKMEGVKCVELLIMRCIYGE